MLNLSLRLNNHYYKLHTLPNQLFTLSKETFKGTTKPGCVILMILMIWTLLMDPLKFLLNLILKQVYVYVVNVKAREEKQFIIWNWGPGHALVRRQVNCTGPQDHTVPLDLGVDKTWTP